MTYQAVEQSVAGGEPQELFRFAQAANLWFYTSADATVVYNAETYLTAPITRGTRTVNRESGAEDLELICGRDLGVVAQFISGSLPSPMFLTIYRKHVSDAEVQTIWIGQVKSIELDGAICSVQCVPMYEAMRRSIPRWGMQLTCNNNLYDTNCGVVGTSFDATGTVSTLVGNVITASLTPVQTAPYFQAGLLQFGVYKVAIIEHTGANLRLMSVPPGLAVSSAITCFAGCDRQFGTCKTKFSNIANFRGFPWIPGRNPWEGL